MRPSRISQRKQHEAPQAQVDGDDVDADGVPGVDLACVDEREDREAELAVAEDVGGDEQGGREEEEGDEVAAAVGAGDEVVG